MNKPQPNFSLALDNLSDDQALKITSQLGTHIDSVKLHDLLDRAPLSPSIFNGSDTNYLLFRYNLHDTPGTIGYRAKSLTEHGANIITVRAEGGVPMMQAAVTRARLAQCSKVYIWACTVDEDLSEDDFTFVFGKNRSRYEVVRELATMAYEAKVDAIICPAKFVDVLQSEFKTVHVISEVDIAGLSAVTNVYTHFTLNRTPEIISRLRSVYAGNIWIDYKLHNDPYVAIQRANALMEIGTNIITIHAAGGREMMKRVAEAVHGHNPNARVRAITVLTSLDDAEIARIYGSDRTREEIVLARAIAAMEAGCDDVDGCWATKAFRDTVQNRSRWRYRVSDRHPSYRK